MPAVSPARKAAFQILLAVERGLAHSDDLLRAKSVNALSSADRNLTTTLVLGVLRWQIHLDRQLQALLKRPHAKLDREVLIALRLGAFQLLHLDRIPARAAIDESVELAKQSGHRFASGMVNAVLRKLAAAPEASDSANYFALKGNDPSASSGQAFSRAAESAKLKEASALKGTGFSPYINPANLAGDLVPEGRSENSPGEAKRTPGNAATQVFPPRRGGVNAIQSYISETVESHPAWMVERWIDFYGIDAAQAICRHGQNQPALSVRLAGPAVETELIQAGIQLAPGTMLTAARTILGGDVTATPAFQEGRARLQDEGSQLIAEIAGENLDQKEKSILDACAAPGGKTLILAERNPQARIVACESSPQRLDQLRKRLAAYAERIECRLADATTLDEQSAFDLVLADVPCSGTGTLGRNPEIRHRLRPEDLARQAERQRAILKTALCAVRSGGRVLYSTCSLEPEENEQVVAAALAENSLARAISIASSIESLRNKSILAASAAERLQRCITPEGALRLLPGAFNTDGFFVALIERTA